MPIQILLIPYKFWSCWALPCQTLKKQKNIIFNQLKQKCWFWKNEKLEPLYLDTWKFHGLKSVVHFSVSNSQHCVVKMFVTFWHQYKKFPDFCKIFTANCPWNCEFKTMLIFAKSLSVSKICKIFIFCYFLTVHNFLRTYFYKNYTV